MNHHNFPQFPSVNWLRFELLYNNCNLNMVVMLILLFIRASLEKMETCLNCWKNLCGKKMDQNYCSSGLFCQLKNVKTLKRDKIVEMSER